MFLQASPKPRLHALAYRLVLTRIFLFTVARHASKESFINTDCD